MSKDRKRLGKGLEAILGPLEDDRTAIRLIAPDQISPNPHQPRRQFDAAALAELADSIRSHGLVQPIIVTPQANGYVLVAGERRWRAAQLAGLSELPAILREMDPQAMTEVALIENLQREQLTPIEEAYAYQTLQEEFDLTQEAIAQRVGKSRSQVANTLRLLTLDPEVQRAVNDGTLSVGHAKVLLAIASAEQQRRIAQQAIAEGWTVRTLEAKLAGNRDGRSRRRTSARSERATPGSGAVVDPHWRDAAAKLQRALGTRVEIFTTPGRSQGRITIEFYSLDEFNRLMEQLGAENI